MNDKLKLVGESKVHRLLNGRTRKDDLEASGVFVLDESTCYVIFDNLNQVAKIDTSLKAETANELIDAPSPGTGFEDITFDFAKRRFYLLIEAMKDVSGDFRGRVAEYDEDFTFQRCSWLEKVFDGDNKGFEGLAHVRHGGKEYLWALCEGNLCTSDEKGGGQIEAFERTGKGKWVPSYKVALPKTAEFKDYSALAVSGDRVALVSQKSLRFWHGKLDGSGRAFPDDAGAVFRFPKRKKYCNVEGVSWLADDRVIAVSDRRKKNGQGKGCAEKDQSIHVFKIPSP